MYNLTKTLKYVLIPDILFYSLFSMYGTLNEEYVLSFYQWYFFILLMLYDVYLHLSDISYSDIYQSILKQITYSRDFFEAGVHLLNITSVDCTSLMICLSLFLHS